MIFAKFGISCQIVIRQPDFDFNNTIVQITPIQIVSTYGFGFGIHILELIGMIIFAVQERVQEPKPCHEVCLGNNHKRKNS